MTALTELILELNTVLKQSSQNPLKEASFLQLAKQIFNQLENMPLEEGQNYLTEINQLIVLMQRTLEAFSLKNTSPTIEASLEFLPQ